MSFSSWKKIKLGTNKLHIYSSAKQNELPTKFIFYIVKMNYLSRKFILLGTVLDLKTVNNKIMNRSFGNSKLEGSFICKFCIKYKFWNLKCWWKFKYFCGQSPRSSSASIAISSISSSEESFGYLFPQYWTTI